MMSKTTSKTVPFHDNVFDVLFDVIFYVILYQGFASKVLQLGGK